MPNAGILFEADAYEWLLGFGFGDSASSSGLRNFVDHSGGSASLETSVAANPSDIIVGVGVYVSGGAGSPYAWSVQVPALGIGLSGNGPSSASFRFTGLKVYATLYTQYRVTWTGWEIRAGGTVMQAGGGGEVTPDYLAPGYLFPWGMSCTLSANAAPNVTFDDPIDYDSAFKQPIYGGPPKGGGTPPIIGYAYPPGLRYLPYEYTAEVTATATGGYRWLKGGTWHDDEIEFRSAGYANGVSATRSSSSSVTAYAMHHERRVVDSALTSRSTGSTNYQWAYATHREGDSVDEQASLTLWPKQSRKLIRMDEGYASVLERLGLTGAVAITTTGYTDGAHPEDETGSSTETTFLPTRDSILGTVRDGTHALEDALADGNPSPYFSSHTDQTGDLTPGGDDCGVFSVMPDQSHPFPNDGWPGYSPCALVPPFRFPVSNVRTATYPYTVTVPESTVGLLVHADPVMTLFQTRSSPLNSVLQWFPPNDDSDTQSQWKVDGSAIDNAAWRNRRMQWEYQAQLPEADATKRLTDLIASCVDESGHTPHQDAYYAPFARWMGISRWTTMACSASPSKTYETCPDALELRADSAPSWSSPDADLTFSADGIHVAKRSDDQKIANLILELEGWAGPPYLYPAVCSGVTIAWTGATDVGTTFVSSFGNAVSGGTHASGDTVPIPRTKDQGYAGSWGSQHGGIDPDGEPWTDDVGTDVASGGQSAAAMADPSRVHAPGALRAKGAARLIVSLTLGDGPNVLKYPVFHKASGNPKVVNLDGASSVILWPDGPMVAYGAWIFFDPDAGFQNPPLVGRLGYKSTIVDGICWRRAVMQGVSPLSGGVTGTGSGTVIPQLTDELYDRFDAYEGQSIAVADKFSISLVLPGSDGTVRIALVNTMAEAPPLALLPSPGRDASWKPAGDGNVSVWDLCKEPRDVVSPVDALQVYSHDGTLLSAPVSAPSGWAIERYSIAVENDELADTELKQNGTLMAKVRPLHGWWWVGQAAKDGTVHLSVDQVTGFFLEAVSDGTSISMTNFRVSGQSITGDAGDGSDAYPWNRKDGTLCVGYSRDSNIYAKFSYSEGKTWGEQELIAPGTLCAPDTDPIHGWDGVAVWNSGSWHLWLKKRKADPTAETWEDRGPIVTAPEKSAGFRFSPTSEGAAIFSYSDGTNTLRKATYDYGLHWEDLTI
jgi:hypothetical protein